jgi:hypothetical protein
MGVESLVVLITYAVAIAGLVTISGLFRGPLGL